MSEEAVVTQMPSQSARDRIRNHPRPKGESLEIPEWDITVELRSMTIKEKGKLIGDDELTPSKLTSFLPEIIIFTCYEADEQIFTAEDLDWLQNEPASVIERVATEGLRVSGMDESAGEEKKDAS